jgi:hypothetical protein
MIDGFDPIGLTPFEVRTAMVANGYNPTPLAGKRPLLDGWQKIVADQQTVERWGNMGPETGMVTAHTPVVDIDIMNEQAAELVEQTIAECWGEILVRIGQHPKRAILARTDAPFRKIVRRFTAPDGSTHKIEVLGDGQQLAVAGIHPDTKKRFAWKGGRSPVNTPRDAQPLVSEQDIVAALDLCAEQLRAKLGWVENTELKQQHNEPGGSNASLEERVAATQIGASADSIRQSLMSRCPGSMRAPRSRMSSRN